MGGVRGTHDRLRQDRRGVLRRGAAQPRTVLVRRGVFLCGFSDPVEGAFASADIDAAIDEDVATWDL